MNHFKSNQFFHLFLSSLYIIRMNWRHQEYKYILQLIFYTVFHSIVNSFCLIIFINIIIYRKNLLKKMFGKFSGAQQGYLKCSIQGTNKQSPNIFYKFILFNCLTLNIKLFIFNLFDVKFCFPKIMSFANKRERLFIKLWTRVLSFRILNSLGEIMTCYLRDIINL